ncbi:hypothetical protein E2C01_013697 [Portunus trituberculatus]|uniref:Uncharacterized protein n=1 Tax=Portunus trituberculatus TaxID=210409 RepID=A0A5B7DGY0_PORTR|nr:hypothetical protein [Portunus trituberculatus]
MFGQGSIFFSFFFPNPVLMALLSLYILHNLSPISPISLSLPVVTLPPQSIQLSFLPNLHVYSLNLPQVAFFCLLLNIFSRQLCISLWISNLHVLVFSGTYETMILLFSLPLVLIVMLKTSASPSQYCTSSKYISSQFIINTPPLAFPLLSLFQTLYP